MHDEPMDKAEVGLRDVIRLGSVDILDQPARFASMLDDFCPRSGYSGALKHAVRMQLPQVLLRQSSAGTLEPIIHSCTKRLHLEEGIDISIAAWTTRLLVHVLQEHGRLPATSAPQPPPEKPIREQSATSGVVVAQPPPELEPVFLTPQANVRVKTRQGGLGTTFAVLGGLIVISGVVWAVKSNQSPKRPEIEALTPPSRSEAPIGRAEPEPERPKEEPVQTPTVQDSHGGEVKFVQEAFFSVEVPEGWTFSGPDNRSMADVWTISNGSGAMLEIHYPHSVKNDPNNTATDLQEYPREQGQKWSAEAGRNYTEIELTTVNFANRRACVWEYTRNSGTELIHRHTTYLGQPYGHALVLSTSDANWYQYRQVLMDIRETFKVEEDSGD